MIIECPSCGSRAKLPDSKEGAKVRCTQCERVYVARAPGSRGKQPSAALPVGIGGGVVVLTILLIAISSRGGPPPARAVEEPPTAEQAAYVDQTGWDSALVKRARELHDAAFQGDQTRLQTSLAEELVWARIRSEERGETVDPAGYADLGGSERLAFVVGVLEGLTEDHPDNLVGRWLPFDGKVIEETDSEATVRLTMHPRDPAQAGTRHVEWKLLKGPHGWRAWSWERWLSPEELAASRITQARSRQRQTLSDGSIVFEAEPERVEHMDSTTPEERARIEALVTQLIDLEARPRARTEAADELRAIGKPAIPGLLNRLYELDHAGWHDHDQTSRGQLVHMLLQDLTGYVTTFNPHEALGGTDERRDSGVRQWFFWYQRKFDRFEGPAPQADLLEEGWEPRNETERREYERYKKLQEQEKDRKP